MSFDYDIITISYRGMAVNMHLAAQYEEIRQAIKENLRGFYEKLDRTRCTSSTPGKRERARIKLIKNPGGVRTGVLCRPSGFVIPPLSAGSG